MSYGLKWKILLLDFIIKLIIISIKILPKYWHIHIPQLKNSDLKYRPAPQMHNQLLKIYYQGFASGHLAKDLCLKKIKIISIIFSAVKKNDFAHTRKELLHDHTKKENSTIHETFKGVKCR